MSKCSISQKSKSTPNDLKASSWLQMRRTRRKKQDKHVDRICERVTPPRRGKNESPALLHPPPRSKTSVDRIGERVTPSRRSKHESPALLRPPSRQPPPLPQESASRTGSLIPPSADVRDAFPPCGARLRPPPTLGCRGSPSEPTSLAGAVAPPVTAVTSPQR